MKRIVIIVMHLGLLLIVSPASAHQWCWTCAEDNTYGWQMMTPEERKQHQSKLQSFKEYDACKEYIYDHHKKMDERAKDKGVELPLMTLNPCAAMKARGQFK